MKRDEFLKKLGEFRNDVALFYRDYGNDEQNKKNGLTKPFLVKKYGSLSKYIHFFTRNIKTYDDLFLDSDDFIYTLFEKEKAKRVLTDIMFIEGVVGSLSNSEFEQVLINDKKEVIKNNNYWNYVNPFWLIYKMFMFFWEHKVVIMIGVFIAVVAAIIVNFFNI